MSTPQLAPEVLAELQHLHDIREKEGYEALYAFVAALRVAGWPLASISGPLKVSREAPRIWERKAAELGLPIAELAGPTKEVTLTEQRAQAVQDRQRAKLENEQAVLMANLPRLLALQPMAEALRGPSKFNPEGAAASAEYTQLIDQTLKAGVRSQTLADALNVQQITLWARLRRSGLRTTAPSEKVPAWARTADWQSVLEGSARTA